MGAEHPVSVPGGSHERCEGALSQLIPHEGGDKRQWRRKPRAGRRRPARSGKLTSPVKKGGGCRPLFNSTEPLAAVLLPLHPRSAPVASHPTVESDRPRPCRR